MATGAVENPFAVKAVTNPFEVKPQADVAGAMLKPSNEMDSDTSAGANNVYLSNQYKGVNASNQAQMNAVHTGVDGVTDEQAYKTYQDVTQTEGNPIDITKFFEWIGGTPPEGDVPETIEARKWYSGITDRIGIARKAISDIGVSATEGGAAYPLTALMDFWPMTYRGTKQLIGLEDFGIPVLDSIAEFSGDIKKNQQLRSEQLVKEFKDAGLLGPAATVRSINAIGDTLTFLNEIKRLNMSYGGGAKAGQVGNVSKMLSTLGHAQKISLFSALTAEDMTWEQRLETWKISSLYMSTPALSGLSKNPALAKTFDFALNSLVSTNKKDGYRDIRDNPELDTFDKLMGYAELLGPDIVFSAITRTFKDQAQPALDYANQIDAMARQGMRPQPLTDIDIARIEAMESGKGFVNVDKKEAEVKADLQATRKQIEADLAKVAEEAREPDATPEVARTPEGEGAVKPTEADTSDYRGQHSAPMSDSGAAGHKLTDTYPDDIYSGKAVDYYGHGSDRAMDQESISIMQGMKDKPNAKVKIYRAVPDDNAKVNSEAKALKNVLSYHNTHGFFQMGSKEADAFVDKYPIEKFSYDEQQSSALKDIEDRISELESSRKPAVKINTGDWVSINRKYVKEHGDSALNGEYKIITKTVPAKDIFTNGDSIHEWGYDPQSARSTKPVVAEPTAMEANVAERGQRASDRAQDNLEAQRTDDFYGMSTTYDRKRYDRVAGQWTDRKTGEVVTDPKAIEALDKKGVGIRDKEERRVAKQRKADVEQEIIKEAGEDPAIMAVLQEGGINKPSSRLVTEFGEIDPMFIAGKKNKIVSQLSGKESATGRPLDEIVSRVNEQLGSERYDENSLVEHINNFASRANDLRDGTRKTENEVYDAMAKEADAGQLLDKSAMEMPAVNTAVKRAIADEIAKNESRSANYQAKALETIVEKLTDVLDAPRGTNEQTLLNRITNISQGREAVPTDPKQFGKALAAATRRAEQTAVAEVSRSVREFGTIAEQNLGYKEADKIKARLQKLAETGPSPDVFARKANEMLDGAFNPKRAIDQVAGVKDISKRADISEAELLRVVMKEREKAAVGARRATVDKIIGSQREAQNILDDMPLERRGKMVSALRAIAAAKTDEAREKALNKFGEMAGEVVAAHDKRVAVTDYKKAEKQAKKMLKSGEVNKETRAALEDVVSSIEAGRVSDGLDKMISKANSLEEVEVATNIKTLLGELDPKPLSQMDAQEVRTYTDALRGLTHQMNQIKKELDKNGRMQGVQDNNDQKSLIRGKVPIERDTIGGKVGETLRKYNFDMIEIPRGIADNLDYYDPSGQFTKYQKSFEQAYEDVYTVQRSVADVLDPYTDYVAKQKYVTEKESKKPSFPATDTSGKPINVKLGYSDRLQVYLALRDSGYLEAALENGWKREAGSDTYFLSLEQMRDIAGSMSAEERAVGDAYLQVGKITGGYMDERSLSLNGYELSLPDFALPRLRIGTQSDLKGADFETSIDMTKGVGFNESTHKMSVESSGRFKQRTQSSAPVRVYDPITAFKGLTDVVARYYGMGEQLRGANRFLFNARVGGDDSLRDQYYKLGKGSTFKTFEDYITHMNEGGSMPSSNAQADRMIKKIAQGGIKYGAGVLKYNPKVVLSQAASLPTAAAVMEPKYVKIMNESFARGPSSVKEMSDRSAYIWNRYRGNTGIILESSGGKKSDRGFGGMRYFDSKVIGSIWDAMEAKSNDEKPFLTKAERDRDISSKVIDNLMQTQPTFEEVSRPELGRVQDSLARPLMLFSSQRNKNLYLGTKAIADVFQKYSDGNLKPADIDKSKKIVKQLMVANAVFAGIQTAFELLNEEMMDNRGSVEKEYKSDDVTEQAQRIAQMYAKNFATAGLSSAGAWMSAINSAFQGFSVDRTPVSSVVNDFKGLGKTMSNLEKMQAASKEGELDEHMEEHWKKYTSDAARGANLAVQPLTGVNIRNIYKYFVEAPLALKSSKERSEQWKDDNPDYWMEED